MTEIVAIDSGSDMVRVRKVPFFNSYEHVRERATITWEQITGNVPEGERANICTALLDAVYDKIERFGGLREIRRHTTEVWWIQLDHHKITAKFWFRVTLAENTLGYDVLVWGPMAEVSAK